MPKFRIIIETDCVHKDEARKIGNKILYNLSVPSSAKVQKVRGRNTGRSRKPKPMVKMKQVCNCNPTADYTCSMCKIDRIALEA